VPPAGRDAAVAAGRFTDAFSLAQGQGQLDNQTALRLKKKLAEEFRNN
jgi:hypothetical protein